MPKLKVRKEKNLLGGEAVEEVMEEETVRITSVGLIVVKLIKCPGAARRDRFSLA